MKREVGDMVYIPIPSAHIEAMVNEVLPNGRLRVTTEKVYSRGGKESNHLIVCPSDTWQVESILLEPTRYADELPERDFYEGDSPDY